MYNLTCLVCSKEFTNSWTHTKFCSVICRKKYFNERYGRNIEIGKNIPTGTIGAMSELLVSANLMINGFSVFRSLSPACFCDLIAIKGNKKYNIEVRTGYLSPTNNKLCFPDKINKDADIFGIAERNSGQVYYLDKEKNKINIF